MKSLKLFLSALLAGMAIGIGGTVYLSVQSSVVGAVLFAVGLYAICAHGLHLFTGKVGYVIDEGAGYIGQLAVIWAGNYAGTALTALAVRASRIAAIAERAEAMCAVKLSDSLISLFALAIFCGLLMFIAVDGYKRTKHPLILLMCVAAFILCGFEHCIADMFYLSLAGVFTSGALLRLAVITLGNGVGGVLIPLLRRLPD